MKILLMGPSSPLRGGIANFNDSLCETLSKSYEVSAVSFSLQYPSVLFPGRSQFKTEEMPGMMTFADRVINSVNPLSWFRAAKIILKKRPQCVVIHYWSPFFAPSFGTIIRLAKRRYGFCVISILHNINPHEAIPATRLLNRYFLNACDGFITMSEKVTKGLRRYDSEKPFRRVNHPLYSFFGEPLVRSEALKILKLDNTSRYILFFGLIREYKGLELLLNAMSYEALKQLDVKLIVAGEFYEGRRKYMNIVKQQGIESRVIFTDSFIPDSDVRLYFSASDLVVLPYMSATQSGVVPVAYHFGKPVVVTDVGGLKEVVTDKETGYLCNRSSGEIAEAIYDFFVNDRSAMFTLNIQQRKKDYSWESVINEIDGLYRDITVNR